MRGGYPQQGYCPPQPSTSWGPPGVPQMQQPGYGYMQPGVYPGPPPPYNMSQPLYGGYPPPPASAGFTSGWDQSSNPSAQQTTPGSGYDYYNQQPPRQQQLQQQPLGGSSPPADNSSYSYGQPPANYNSQGLNGDSTFPQSSVGQQQGYGQDGYSGGYDQPQGYGRTSSAYGAMANTAQDGSAPTYSAQGGPTQVPPAQQAPPPFLPSVSQQGYTGQQPTATTASYPSQGTAQAGYGVPPTSQTGYGSQPPAQSGYGQSPPSTQPSYGQPPQGQKPSPSQAVYGQAQQSPTTQCSYIQPPAQAGYPHGQPPPAQSGYVQDSTHYRPPGFAPGGTQTASGQQQSYGGAPPQSQPGYGQQRQQPFGDSYGGAGYSQPPAYSSDKSVHGAYDAPAAPQAVPSGVAKASPLS